MKHNKHQCNKILNQATLVRSIVWLRHNLHNNNLHYHKQLTIIINNIVFQSLRTTGTCFLTGITGTGTGSEPL